MLKDIIYGNGIAFPNVPTSVWDNGDFWTTISEENGFKLQQNDFTGHARIINENRIRLAWGSLDAMKGSFRKLIKPWDACEKGDILAVKRAGGLFFHYAVYIGEGNVIHYAPKDKVIGQGAFIHKASFNEFIENETSYEILEFSDDGSRARHRRVDLVDNNFQIDTVDYEIIPDFGKYARRWKGYRIYSAEETVKRAESRLGETEYNLLFNNCEHFALWCKTGISECTQVEEALKRLLSLALGARRFPAKSGFFVA